MTTTAPESWTLTKLPRDWQSLALDSWQRSLRGIASVVTGGGKTIFAQMCMEVFRQRYPLGRFVIVVPTQALLDQWYVSLREDLLVPANEIATFSGEGRPADIGIVNLMVINTARVHAPRVPERHDAMLIVDECHRAASESNALSLRGEYKAALGISATPEREYDDLFHNILVPTLGPVIFEYNYSQALSDGVIVPFDLFNVSTDMTTEEQQTYDDASLDISRTYEKVESGQVSREVLVRKLQRRARLAASSIQRIPVAIRLAEQHRDNRIIVFHESIRSAESILEILLARRFNATIYHSKISAELRRDNLRLFRRGVFDALVTCRALDEGANIPETDVAIVASSTGSLRQRVQRLGRVLRPAPGKPRAKIYTIYVSKPEENRLIKEARTLAEAGEITWMRSSVGRQDAASV